MIIPHRMLSPDALRGVIEAFVTREGTDYGTVCTCLFGCFAHVSPLGHQVSKADEIRWG
jgi:uncharacterized protein YheU (UPF0270 family)